MTVTAGKLIFLSVEYVRTARYRTRHQTESHRTPRYRVRYQLENHSAHEAMVGPNPLQYLVAHIRASKPGDIVEVRLSKSGADIVDWTNRTDEELMRDFGGTWFEQCDL
ncbi:hypothetical protein BZM26_28890 [Paraburkholderia strydomiana]|nr:hypothetical protein BZM26_28890 [Paraburkholderia strydomiana]